MKMKSDISIQEQLGPDIYQQMVFHGFPKSYADPDLFLCPPSGKRAIVSTAPLSDLKYSLQPSVAIKCV